MAMRSAATLRVEVRSETGSIGSADVFVNDVAQTTNAQGVITATVAPGTVEVVVVKEGFAPASGSVEVHAN
jgi:hypothetical protein